MRWRLAVLFLLGTVPVARAATWDCFRWREALTHEAYVVAASCTATGTYSATGDVMGGAGTNAQLCHSAKRHVRIVMVSSAASAAGNIYVGLWDHQTAHIVLATAAATPGPSAALVELAAGTPIDGVTIRTLSFCD